jgi:TetR/AcrR family transcriptional regulator
VTVEPRPLGRRERNKQDKLERITVAARELFTERGVDDVTTQEIADRADVGAGTLFLYARNKGELLLLAQNAAYADALDRGARSAAEIADPLDAVLAILRPVVECNRRQVDNGRTYLREMAFGDPEEPHHRTALEIVARTEADVADALRRDGRVREDDAASLAHVVSAVMLLSMGATANAGAGVEEIVDDLRTQLGVILRTREPHRPR